MVRRVAMVLNSPGLGGVPEVVRALVPRLSHDEFAPFVFLLKPGEPEGLEALKAAGITPVIADPSGGKISVISQLADWLLDQRIDILHTHSFRPNLYGRMAGAICRPAGLKIISHYHNLYDEKWQGDAHALSLERRLAGVTDAMVAVSEAVRTHVATTTGMPHDRIEVVRNGVDLRRFGNSDRTEGRRRLGLRHETFAVGLVGRICRQKGQDIFLEAARQLSDLTETRFLVIGHEEDATLAQSLRNRIITSGLGSRMHLVGHISDMPPVLAALDLLVMPSRWEGMPLVLLEAMATGTPVIATPVGGTPEVVRDTGAACLVPPEDAGALALAIRSLVRDPDTFAALSAAGRALTAAFSWDAAAARLTGIYRGLYPEDRP